MKSALLAYSGGVDSTFLLKVAGDTLGDKIVAVTALSVIYPAHETEDAKRIAESFGVKHLTVTIDSLSNNKFTKNSPQKCYWCKQTLFLKLSQLADEYKLNCVLDGSNHDDIKDFRPGMKAALDSGVKSPLKEVGFSKNEIRTLSKTLGLITWNKPSCACLASRIQYGIPITKQNISMVSNAENFLRGLGIIQVRVRHHNQTARIEVRQGDIPRFLDETTRKKILTCFKELGYHYVTLDLEGYRTGSMNEVLEKNRC